MNAIRLAISTAAAAIPKIIVLVIKKIDYVIYY